MIMPATHELSAMLRKAASECGLNTHVVEGGFNANMPAERVSNMLFGTPSRAPHINSYLYQDSIDACFYFDSTGRACCTFTAKWYADAKDIGKLGETGELLNRMLKAMDAAMGEYQKQAETAAAAQNEPDPALQTVAEIVEKETVTPPDGSLHGKVSSSDMLTAVDEVLYRCQQEGQESAEEEYKEDDFWGYLFSNAADFSGNASDILRAYLHGDPIELISAITGVKDDKIKDMDAGFYGFGPMHMAIKAKNIKKIFQMFYFVDMAAVLDKAFFALKSETPISV